MTPKKDPQEALPWQGKSIYPIGLRFTRLGRNNINREFIETIVDILTTTNNAGTVVQVRYVTTHDFAGQCVVDKDVPSSTIARATILETP